MKTIHSPACYRLLSDWRAMDRDSAHYRISSYAYIHTDVETRDLLLTIFADDPADSEAAAAARELWPLLVIGDPVHDPEDLRDELADLIQDHEMLRVRMLALAAKFRAIVPWSEMWNRYPHPEPEFGDLNIEWTIEALRRSESMMSGHVAEQLDRARECAGKLRVYESESVTR